MMCETETPTERTAVIVALLAHGHGLTTREAAVLTGLTRHGAYVMLCRISRVFPIFQDDGGQWREIDTDPAC